MVYLSKFTKNLCHFDYPKYSKTSIFDWIQNSQLPFGDFYEGKRNNQINFDNHECFVPFSVGQSCSFILFDVQKSVLSAYNVFNCRRQLGNRIVLRSKQQLEKSEIISKFSQKINFFEVVKCAFKISNFNSHYLTPTTFLHRFTNLITQTKPNFER